MKKVYLHVPELTGWHGVLVDLLEKMDNSGLIDAADEINLCANGVRSNMEKFLLPILRSNSKIKLVHVAGDATKWEWPTINKIKHDADSSNTDDMICYTHLKGLSPARSNDPKSIDWRNYLVYWTLERWEDSVEKIEEGYELAGVNWLTAPFPHLSGNSWWATSNYIRRLPVLHDPGTIEWGSDSEYIPNVKLDEGNWRFEQEAWIGSSKPKVAEMHYSHNKADPSFHYNNQYPASNYRK
jgi:hypothetical protein